MYKSRSNALERPAAMLGLSLVFAIIGTPYLLHALGIETSWLSDELLGKCPRRARTRGLACDLSPYAISTMLGLGFFFCAAALALAISAISKQLEEIARFIGVVGHIGLGYAGISYFFRPLDPKDRSDGFFALMAGFVCVYCIVYLALYFYWLKKPWNMHQPKK
jgi:hypothetical protein